MRARHRRNGSHLLVTVPVAAPSAPPTFAGVASGWATRRRACNGTPVRSYYVNRPCPSGRRSSRILGPVPGAVGTTAHLRPGRPALPRHVRDPSGHRRKRYRRFSGRPRPGSAAFDRTDAMQSSSHKRARALGPVHRLHFRPHRAVPGGRRARRPPAPGPGPRAPGGGAGARRRGRGPEGRAPARGISCAAPAHTHIRISADRRGGPGPGVMDARGAPTLQGRCVARWHGRDGLDDSLTVPGRAVLL
jgi:hypothetical protein